MGSYSRHQCAPGSVSLGALVIPAYVLPGNPVFLGESETHGRSRFLWRCCGTLLVECMRTQDPECGDTYTIRVPVAEVEPVPWGTSYSVPCVGAEWSLYLPCGHVAGEGCDCDTIALEADAV